MTKKEFKIKTNRAQSEFAKASNEFEVIYNANLAMKERLEASLKDPTLTKATRKYINNQIENILRDNAELLKKSLKKMDAANDKIGDAIHEFQDEEDDAELSTRCKVITKQRYRERKSNVTHIHFSLW
jgi:flagellar biosynthesis/type III secretory pathway chaperone